MPQVSFMAKRSMGILAGGLAMAAALAWFIKRQRAKKDNKRIEGVDSVDQKANETFKKQIQQNQEAHSKLNKQEMKHSNESNKTEMVKEQTICDSGGGGDGHSMKPTQDPKEVPKSMIAPLAERESYEINSSTESSPLTSEHSGDVEDIVTEECHHALGVQSTESPPVAAGDMAATQECAMEMMSPVMKLLTNAEAPFSWSAEVEMDALSKLSSPISNNSNMNESRMNGVISVQDGYQPADSPSAASDEGSQDSGRATGGLASSMSPADETGQDGDVRHMYEFEIPNSLVGLIIGIKGKTIKELCTRTAVKMIIRPHHTPSKVETHQICTVEGPRENINRCLQMLRRRFPTSRFPELNLEPVLPPPIPSPAAEVFGTQPTQLSLPEGHRCQVTVTSMVDAGHFFVQQVAHPSFPSLARLDYYMLAIYSQTTGIPDLPKPCETGLLCVAPASGGWYRAVTVVYYDDQDEVLVRFVDYGGYSRIPRADLRQIRTDFMTLPFQSVECYIAHVQPVDGSSTWSEAAIETFHQLAMSKVIEAFVVGYNVDDLTPVVELFITDDSNLTVRLDRALLDAGLARASDPSKVKRVLPKPALSPAIDDDSSISVHS